MLKSFGRFENIWSKKAWFLYQVRHKFRHIYCRKKKGNPRSQSDCCCKKKWLLNNPFSMARWKTNACVVRNVWIIRRMWRSSRVAAKNACFAVSIAGTNVCSVSRLNPDVRCAVRRWTRPSWWSIYSRSIRRSLSWTGMLRSSTFPKGHGDISIGCARTPFKSLMKVNGFVK